MSDGERERPVHILLVEDEPDLRNTLRYNLKRNGYGKFREDWFFQPTGRVANRNVLRLSKLRCVLSRLNEVRVMLWPRTIPNCTFRLNSGCNPPQPRFWPGW